MSLSELAAAVFVSDLQPSQRPTPDQIFAAIEGCQRRRGIDECTAATAAEYGEHPDTAPARMRWALELVEATVPGLMILPRAPVRLRAEAGPIEAAPALAA